MSKEIGKAVTMGAVAEDDDRPRSDTAVIDDPLLGKLIDERYRIAMRLGMGGMGIVYEARHEILGSRLAFKVLRGNAAGDEEAVERLKREAQAASAIGNEHIVDVRDFGRLEDGSVYIVMELIEGTDLYTLVKQEALAWERARDIAVQIAEALFAAHEQGIVHRDLKLENVLLTTRKGRKDFVKVVDFGIAKVQGSSKLTAAGRVMGTPEYMSPEQCSGKTVDHRTDIYSLGVMIYEMITQKLPFWDADLVTLIKKQMYEKPVPPSQLRPDLEIPLSFEALVLRCLAKDPDSRYQTMRDVVEALRVEGATSAPLPAPIAPVSQTAAVVPARATPTQGNVARPNRWMIPAIAVGALVLIAGGVGWLVGGDLAEPEPVPRATRPEPVPVEVPPEPAAQPDPVEVAPAVVEAPARSAEVTITSDPEGARVFGADDAYLGDTPFRIRRPPAGERVSLSVRREGYTNGAVLVSELSNETLHVALDPARGRPRPQPSSEQPPPSQPDPQPLEQPEQRRRHQEFLDPWGGGQSP